MISFVLTLALVQSILFWSLIQSGWLLKQGLLLGMSVCLGTLCLVLAASAVALLWHQAALRRHWEGLVWQDLRQSFAPKAHQQLAGLSGWAVEVAYSPLSGPGAAWADLRQGPLDSELAWLVASIPPMERAISTMVCRGAASAKWQALGQGDLTEAIQQVAQVALVPDAWAAWAARLDASSGELCFAGDGAMLAFTVDRRGRLGYLWGGAGGDVESAIGSSDSPGMARLAEGSAILVLDAALIHAPGSKGEPYGLARLERLVRDRPGCDASTLSQLVVDALQRFQEGAPPQREGVVAVCRLVACGP